MRFAGSDKRAILLRRWAFLLTRDEKSAFGGQDILGLCCLLG
jgi:hypothetical protein